MCQNWRERKVEALQGSGWSDFFSGTVMIVGAGMKRTSRAKDWENAEDEKQSSG